MMKVPKPLFRDWDEKGIRCKTGAVPATVIPTPFGVQAFAPPSHCPDRIRGEKASKSRKSQETCLDQLILCFRRKSEEDMSISLFGPIRKGVVSISSHFFQARIELNFLFDQA